MPHDQIRQIVSEVEQALGPNAEPELIESVASLVLERLGRGDKNSGATRAPASNDFGVVTATGTNVGTTLALLSNLLADSGAVVVDVDQTAKNGLFALMLRVNLNGLKLPLAELRKRLQAAAASGDVRVSVHREDLFAAMHSS